MLLFKVPVVMWHGDKDPDVPLSAAITLHQGIKHSELNIIAGENHSLIRRHWASILNKARTVMKAKL